MKYMIAPGKSFTTPNCGVVSEYQEVTPKKIGSMFDSLKKAGAIVEMSERPEVVHSVNLRKPRYKEQFPDRKLQAPAVAEVRKVEVIEPIKKKEPYVKKQEVKVIEEIEELEIIPETKLDEEDEKDLF